MTFKLVGCFIALCALVFVSLAGAWALCALLDWAIRAMEGEGVETWK
jgi:hypothetical protein